MKFIKVTIDQIVPDAWNLSPEGNVLAWSPITNVIAVCTPNVIHLLRPMISPLREPFFERGYISHAVTGNIGNYSQVCWQTEPGSPDRLIIKSVSGTISTLELFRYGVCNERSWRLVQNLFSEAHKVVKSIASFHQLVNGSYKTLIALLDSAHKIYSSNSDESISHILAHNLPEATRLLLTSVNEVLVFNNIGSLIALIDFSKNSFLNPIRAKLTPDEHSIYPQSSLLPKNLQSTASLDKINGFDHTPLQVGPAYMNFFCKLNIIYETPKNQTLKPQMIVSLEKRLQPIVFLCPTGSSPSLMAVTFDTCAYIINPDERSSLKIKPPWDLEALEFEEAEGESPEADDANENNFFCAGGITSASGLSAACLIVQKRVPPQSPKAVLYLLSTYDFESAIYEKNTKSSVGPGLQSLFEYQWLSNHAETVIMMAKPNTTNPHNISSIRKCVICDESMTSVDSEKKYIKCTSCSIGVCLPL